MGDRITLDGETYLELDVDEVGFADALTVEKHLGVEWVDFLKSLAPLKNPDAPHVSSMAKLQALAWLARHPHEPDLKIEDVNDPVSKFGWADDEEVPVDPLPSGSEDSSDGTESSSTSSTASSPGTGTA